MLLVYVVKDHIMYKSVAFSEKLLYNEVVKYLYFKREDMANEDYIC